MNSILLEDLAKQHVTELHEDADRQGVLWRWRSRLSRRAAEPQGC